VKGQERREEERKRCSDLENFETTKILLYIFISLGAVYLFIYSFSFICAYNVWVISPLFPCPLPSPPRPLPPLPPPCYPTETTLPLSLILLKREYKQ
jgi:hypothetical protein